jgi:hypothetical protein
VIQLVAYPAIHCLIAPEFISSAIARFGQLAALLAPSDQS